MRWLWCARSYIERRGKDAATKTRHLGGLGQVSEFEQGNNTNSEQESNTDSRSVCDTGEFEQQSNTEPGQQSNTDSQHSSVSQQRQLI